MFKVFSFHGLLMLLGPYGGLLESLASWRVTLDISSG